MSSQVNFLRLIRLESRNYFCAACGFRSSVA